MARWLLTRLAAFVFLGGIAVAVFLPNTALNICNTVPWLGCGAQNVDYMRVVVGIGAGLLALVIWQIAQLTRR